jgi:hypothetical protein
MRISNFNETFYSERLGITRDDVCVFGIKSGIPLYLHDGKGAGGIRHFNQDLKSKVDKYNVIIFSTLEHIRIDYIYEFIEHCIERNKLIIFDTFTFGYEDVLFKKYNSDLIQYRPIGINFIKCITFLKDINHSSMQVNIGERNTLLKFCSFNRNLGKDYIIWELNKRNLLYDSRNIITYHNNLNGMADKSKSNLLLMKDWYSDEEIQLAGDIDFDYLNQLSIIPDTEQFDVGSLQIQQRERLISMHNDSMFNIVIEACYAFTNDVDNPKYNFASLFTKTIFPMFYMNVIHTMPKHCKLIDKLKELGFETFLDSDDEFFDNMNVDYYNSIETQNKLVHNRNLVIKLTAEATQKYGKDGSDWILKLLTN